METPPQHEADHEPSQGTAPERGGPSVGKASGQLARAAETGRATARRFAGNVRANRAFLDERARRRPQAMPRLRFAYFLAVTLTLVAIAAIVFDQPVASYRQQWPGWLVSTALHLTDIGNSSWILIPTGIALLVAYAWDWDRLEGRARVFAAKWTAAAGFIFAAVAGSGFLVLVVKYAIGRARPRNFEEFGAFAFHPFHGSGFASFPSGHATTVGAFFAAVALFFPKLRLPCLIVGLWIGITRILVGSHHVSDVIAGLALGTWFAYATAMTFARYGIIFRFDPTGWPVTRRGYQLVKNRRLRRILARLR